MHPFETTGEHYQLPQAEIIVSDDIHGGYFEIQNGGRYLADLGGGPAAGAVVKAACLESRRSRFEPRFGIQVSKKQNFSHLLTRRDSILWGAFGTKK